MGEETGKRCEKNLLEIDYFSLERMWAKLPSLLENSTRPAKKTLPNKVVMCCAVVTR